MAEIRSLFSPNLYTSKVYLVLLIFLTVCYNADIQRSNFFRYLVLSVNNQNIICILGVIILTDQKPHFVRRHDKRSSRTRRALADALFELLEHEEFQKVTVNDICDQAEVSRPTFYTYFDDKYALLHFCIEQFYQEILDDATERGGSHRDIITATLDHLEHHAKSFRHLLLGETNRELSNVINTAFYDLNYESLYAKQLAGWDNRIPIEVTSLFRAGGSIAIMTWWVTERHSVSKERMVDYLLELNGSEESIFNSDFEIV